MSPEGVGIALRWGFALLAVGAIVVCIVVPLLRFLRQKPDAELMTPDYASLLDSEEELELPADDEHGFDRSAAISQAREDPRATAVLVQQWLRQRK